MKITERLTQYIEYKGISKYRFYKETGLSNGFLDKSTSIGVDKCERICTQYADINIEWLVTGKGDMLINNQANSTNTSINTDKENILYKNSIPLIPVDAIAGFVKSDCSILNTDIIDRYLVPEFKDKNADYLIRVSGSSMYPKYSNGDILACRSIVDITFFQWGKVYVLDSDQGPLVKRIFPCVDNEKYLECRSDNNENYPPFLILKSSIRRVALVVGVIRLE